MTVLEVSKDTHSCHVETSEKLGGTEETEHKSEGKTGRGSCYQSQSMEASRLISGMGPPSSSF